MAHYEDFVFRGGWRYTLEGFAEEFGEDYAKEVLWNIMTMATAGDLYTEKKSIINFIVGAVMPIVDSAKARYTASVDNGKKGGRPQKEIDMKAVDEMVARGESWTYIANYISKTETNITSEGIRKKYKKWKSLQDVVDATNKASN